MAERTARQEWAAGWPLMVTCMVGVSAPTLAHYTMGQFMAPMEHDLGWTRTQASLGLTLSLLVSFVMAPLIGRAADLINVRLMAIVGVVLTGFAYAGFSLANHNVTWWVTLWVIHAFCTSLISPMIWLSVIPTHFTASRSLATAVTLTGTSLTVVFGPLLAQMLTDAYSWRIAFRLLALFWFGMTLLLTLTFFFDRRENVVDSPEHADRVARRESIWPLFRSADFLKLALAIFAVFLIDSAFLVHLSPALVDKGFGRLDAAKLVGLSGVTAIVGKLITGWIFDRMAFRNMATVVMVMLAASCALFPLFGSSLPVAVMTCVLLGLTIGAMYTVTACVIRQLFGNERFGFVFGALTSVMALASASGPLLGSAVHDRTGSYDGVYWVGVAVAILSAVILRTLRPVVAMPTA